MNMAHLASVLLDRRGAALPMAMLTLLILSVLIIGFSVLSATEPTIAGNQLRVAQARAFAEAGVERAIWALGNPAHANGIDPALPIPAPYDGSAFVPVTTGGNTLGGFRVTVANGAALYERNITAVGWVPNDTTAGPKAHQKITVTVLNPRLFMKDPPAALSVRGELQLGGNSLVDSRQVSPEDTSCGPKHGTVTTGLTVDMGSSDVWGAVPLNPLPADTSNTRVDAAGGAIPGTAGDIVTNVAKSLPEGTPGAAFDQFLLTDLDIDALRAYAKAHGTYVKGAVTFNSSNKLPEGLVFVDTVSETNITQEGVTPATLAADFAAVSIHGGAASGLNGAFNGWLFVNGGLSISGNFEMNGFAYVQNDISYHGTGTGGLNGAMLSRNIRDTSSTTIDSDLIGNAKIIYNCQAAKTGGGTITNRWSLKQGTYKEVSGS